MAHLDTLKAHPLPFAVLMGVQFISASLDEVVATLEVRPDLCTAGSIVHGGALMAFADTVGAAATYLNLPAGAKGTTTIESKTNFLSSGPVGQTLTATATPVHRGARTQVWQTRITREDGKAVALVTQTQLVL
ncbi:PaaI family thioesterase [Phreatobacter aquaticus]|uniref:PaaI family thioesterase n=1 Tax=Phreatobacter aquaticus TaxID=2570229 RepID=A0A4D7QPF8_9HYPH|nr:PaaI family thioesterase [Phreatobacter aquaticus]QCK88341.1 PaaI family thioesterase [Phreatobacter aquaticus]